MFTPDKKGDLSAGTLYALDTPNGHDGAGTWIEISDAGAALNSQTEATASGANGYSRPEDVETDESTGKDKNNGGQTLYVAVTGTDEVLAIDLRKKDKPYVYDYIFNVAHSVTSAGTPNATSEFDAPDNLALDEKGNLAITEDPGGDPPPVGTKSKGDDIWIAAPPKGGPQGQPAATVQRFATLKDCAAEPSGIYFAMDETEKWTKDTAWEDVVEDETLFVHRMHSGQGTSNDQSIAISPTD
jgi:secreted PhoX family phosphatase